jgi:hypothetical protein
VTRNNVEQESIQSTYACGVPRGRGGSLGLIICAARQNRIYALVRGTDHRDMDARQRRTEREQALCGTRGGALARACAISGALSSSGTAPLPPSAPAPNSRSSMRTRSSFIATWTGGTRPAPAPPAPAPHGSASERWPPSDARGAAAQGSCVLALTLPAGTQPPPSAGTNAAAPGARKPGSNASGGSARGLGRRPALAVVPPARPLRECADVDLSRLARAAGVREMRGPLVVRVQEVERVLVRAQRRVVVRVCVEGVPRRRERERAPAGRARGGVCGRRRPGDERRRAARGAACRERAQRARRGWVRAVRGECERARRWCTARAAVRVPGDGAEVMRVVGEVERLNGHVRWLAPSAASAVWVVVQIVGRPGLVVVCAVGRVAGGGKGGFLGRKATGARPGMAEGACRDGFEGYTSCGRTGGVRREGIVGRANEDVERIVPGSAELTTASWRRRGSRQRKPRTHAGPLPPFPPSVSCT